MLLTILMASTSLALGLAPLWLTFRLASWLRRERPTTDRAYDGDVSIILPCKGLDPGFDENIHAVLGQDYPNLRFIFAVATREDPAREAIEKILEVCPRDVQKRCEVIVAGIHPHRAQKLSNQLAALDRLEDSNGAIVFLDSDARPDVAFVRRLVGPLSNPGVGATTGFRFYHPRRPSLGGILRSAWNAGALPFLANRRTCFAWGGAMALTQETMRRAGVVAAWQNAVSDDLLLTTRIKDLGLELRFMPDCLAISHEDATVFESIEFTNRQSILSKVYLPPLWLGAALGHSLANLLVIVGCVGLFQFASSGDPAALVASTCLLLVPLQMLNAGILLKIVTDLLPSIAESLRSRAAHYIVLAPLASWLSLLNTAVSLFSRKIVWRGVTYELHSVDRTTVTM